MRVRLRTDASAAKGIAARTVLGKIRHIEVHQLWLQEKVNNGIIEVMKVKGDTNLADAMTKLLDGVNIRKHIELIGQVIMEGRHELNPELETSHAQESESEDGCDGAIVGLDNTMYCFHSPWGYTPLVAAYSDAAHVHSDLHTRASSSLGHLDRAGT